MKPLIQFCPACTQAKIIFDGQKRYFCTACGWEFFHNPAAAVGVFLDYQDDLVLIERNQEPGKGMLDLVGGFVDPGETAEQALMREMQEEIGTQAVTHLRYVSTFPNRYAYNGIVYPTLDIVFAAHLLEWPLNYDREEVACLHRLSLDRINPDQMAFASMRVAWRYFQKLSKP